MQKIVFRLLFFLSLTLVPVKVLAQQQEYITGRLFDSQTKEPLVFANIRIKDRALGIITNADGSYRIPLRYKEYGNIAEYRLYRGQDESIENQTTGQNFLSGIGYIG